MSKMPNMIKTPNMSETASESRDANMANTSSIAGTAGKLPRIEDGLNQLKPANFKCELLNYDNVKTWKTQMKQLLSLQECWLAMEATIKMGKDG
jgi:hypothetical protein